MITSSVNRVIYKGNGVATEFAYPFKIFDRTDIKVLLVDKDGNRSILTSDYYVDMEAMKVYYPGYAPGAVEPGTEQPAILQEGETLVVYRDVPITQMDRMPENYPFDVNERMHDKSCVIDQQLADAVNRGLSASVDAPEGFVGDVPIVAGKSFRISSDGMRLETTEDPARVLPLAQALLEQTAAAAENAGISADITQEDVRIVIEIRNTFPQTVATANAALNQTKDDYKGELREAYEAHSNALNQEYAGYTAGLTDKQVEAEGAVSEAKGDATGTIAADKTNAVRAVDAAKTDAVDAISVNKSTALSDLDTAKTNAIDEVQAAISDVTSDRARAETAANHAQEYKDLAYQYMQGSVNIPVGTPLLWFWGEDTIPVGFIRYTTSALSATTYPDLFALVGHKYGGSGDEFYLPPNLYGNSDTVQPKSITAILIIKAFAGASASSTDLEITNVANEVVGLAGRTDVVASGENYIRYANGLQICWGVTYDNTEFTFPMPFKDITYSLILTHKEENHPNTILAYSINDMTNTKVLVRVWNVYAGGWLGLPINIMAIGKWK